VDLSPGQQKAVFAVVVVVLAALGYWLILPKVTHSSASAHPSASPTPAATASQAATPPPSTATASPAATGSVDIYSWLPFTQQGLAAAAAVTVKFCAAYNTYSYTESAADYVAAMNGLITPQLATTLKGVYATPGVAQVRTSQKEVSTGTASIDSLRAFGPSSLTFVVTGTQHLVTAKGTTNGSAQYAVTVTGSGTGWQVNDIELSTTGQS
jgi:hypothetical protein